MVKILSEYDKIESSQLKTIINQALQTYNDVSEIDSSVHSDDQKTKEDYRRFKESERMKEKKFMVSQFSKFGYSQCKRLVNEDMQSFYKYLYAQEGLGKQIEAETERKIKLYGDDISRLIDKVFNNGGKSEYYY